MKSDIRNREIKVRFCEESNDVKEIQTISNGERDSLWYTKEDLRKIRAQHENDDIIGQGNLTQQLKRKFVRALLEQQDENRKMGIMNDPKGLFQFSRAYSKSSRETALKLARTHEEEVKQLFVPPEKKCVVGSLGGDLFRLGDEKEGFAAASASPLQPRRVIVQSLPPAA